MASHRFETVLEAEGGSVFFQVPLDVPATFGKARAPVRGTINGHPFRSTVAVYGGRSYLPVNRALRDAAGVAAGDAVVTELEAADPEARAAFDGLSFTHQREYAEWVAGAKREATRRRRSTRPSRCCGTAGAIPRPGQPASIVPSADRCEFWPRPRERRGRWPSR
jgi:Domain of unknown function (DUF1905)/Bacteriocin-protection, YdeI or OmpD-Associated